MITENAIALINKVFQLVLVNVAVGVVPLLQVMFVAQASGLEEYGVVALWQGIAAMCVGIALSGNNEASLTLLKHKRATYNQLYRYRLGVCSGALVIFWAVVTIFGPSENHIVIAYLCASTIFLEGLIPQWWFIAKDKIQHLALFFGGVRVIALLLTFALHARLGVASLPLSNMLSCLAVAAIFFRIERPLVGSGVPQELRVELTMDSAFLSGSAVLRNITLRAIPITIQLLGGYAAVGAYDIIEKGVNVWKQVLGAFVSIALSRNIGSYLAVVATAGVAAIAAISAFTLVNNIESVAGFAGEDWRYIQNMAPMMLVMLPLALSGGALLVHIYQRSLQRWLIWPAATASLVFFSSFAVFWMVLGSSALEAYVPYALLIYEVLYCLILIVLIVFMKRQKFA